MLANESRAAHGSRGQREHGSQHQDAIKCGLLRAASWREPPIADAFAVLAVSASLMGDVGSPGD